jgi:hypothetical protein
LKENFPKICSGCKTGKGRRNATFGPLPNKKRKRGSKNFFLKLRPRKNIRNFFECIQKPKKCLPSPPKQLIRAKVFLISKAPDFF